METKTEQKMEILFGFFGILTATILIITSAFITPGYTPLEDTVSSLGYGTAKSLFSIGFVIAGSLSIPFYLYLQRELININEKIRKFATGTSIFSSVCINPGRSCPSRGPCCGRGSSRSPPPSASRSRVPPG